MLHWMKHFRPSFLPVSKADIKSNRPSMSFVLIEGLRYKVTLGGPDGIRTRGLGLDRAAC
jgi:hypothetical protein